MNNKGTLLRKFKSWFYYYLPMMVVIVLLIVGIAFFTTMAGKRSAQKDELIAKMAEEQKVDITNIGVLKVSPTKLVDSIDLPGIVVPWESVTLKAEVSGQIIEILKDEGDFVAQGEVIAKIDNRDYVAAVKEAKANLELNNKELQRSESLFKKKIISKSDYDTAVAPALAAESELELSQLKLERCEIKASFAGTINKRYVQLGALVSAGSSVVDVLDTEKVRVNIFIPESDVLQVSALQEAEISLGSDGRRVYTGKKIFLSQQPNDDAQAYLLQLEVDNKDGELRPGMFVEGRIVRSVNEKAYVLPAYSIIPEGKKTYCFVVEKDTARKREIVTGILSGDQLQVVSGIKEGETIVIKGQRQLEEGDVVRIVDDATVVNETSIKTPEMLTFNK